MKAQIFDIGDDGRLSVLGPPHDVAALAAEVFAAFSDHIPPPNIWDLV
jgi:hypothetical protein